MRAGEVAGPGARLSRRLHDEVVAPVLLSRWPGLAYAAGRLGSGSDVLGLDDQMSQDHDWGLRLNLCVPEELVAPVDQHLDVHLPSTFDGHPVRFATTWDADVRHRVEVQHVAALVESRTGLAGTEDLTVRDWLSLTGQSLLEVTAGPVFVDDVGELTAARERLRWYPDEVWLHVVAADWARLAQELPFVGRTGDRGDDLGSAVLAARLAAVLMHLAHLLARRWPPYPKWLGTSLRALPAGDDLTACLGIAVQAQDWRARQEGLVEAIRMLHRQQAVLGLPAVAEPVVPFFDRPYCTVADEVVTVLHDAVTDPVVRALPRGVGSAEQWSHNVDVLVHPARRPQVPWC